MPYKQHIHELLTAVGDTHVVGPSNFFEAIPKQDDISEATAQLFMGSRIDCAKCHNHPFESWTQDDYYRIVAVFARIRQDNDEITVATMGEATNPSTGKVMVPWGLETVSQAGGPARSDRREIFSNWLTKHDNPFFSRVAVNRIWAKLLGAALGSPGRRFSVVESPVESRTARGVSRRLRESRLRPQTRHSNDLQQSRSINARPRPRPGTKPTKCSFRTSSRGD